MIAIAVGGLSFGFTVCFLFHSIVGAFWHVQSAVLES